MLLIIIIIMTIHTVGISLSLSDKPRIDASVNNAEPT